MVSVTETFISIQGEGLTVGKPAFFIRTGKCSIKCKFCDTPYSWNSQKSLKVEEILKLVEKAALPTVVITGGEPLEEKEIKKLIGELTQLTKIKEIILETCGAYYVEDLPEEKLKVVVSPKPPSMKENFPVENTLKLIKRYRNSELKVGVLTEKDLSFAKNLIYKLLPFLSFSPVIQPIESPEENYEETSKRVIELVVSDRKFVEKTNLRIIPQVHKLLGIK